MWVHVAKYLNLASIICVLFETLHYSLNILKYPSKLSNLKMRQMKDSSNR